MPVLELNGVRLRPLERSDYEALWGLYSPDIFFFMLNQVETKEKFDNWLETGVLAMETGHSCRAFAVTDADTGEMMGTTRIFGIDPFNKLCEIGSTFYGKAFQGTHVNTTAKYLLLRHCFEELGMIRVQFKTDSENIRSQKAIARIGAKHEGVLRNERIRSTGKPRDVHLYSIIDREWPNVKRRLEELMDR
ncbi:GNAT family N-acetyltransferase [Edaphobacillus lindanitolerans]|uniref:Protein N-acetyltransferase, RimJ/RimL family n=1 Tax=Edaphobacillus lindanitolerans TaxID=550447 RepID=A0A1U7PPS2_9BACI|nr:GNAT family protein [Edaphobacillus lindanitolerans]SIT88088.1 Protein N-acetyltransferase, RimJ/RimL family [Edaphobacillus lindanitolerans]